MPSPYFSQRLLLLILCVSGLCSGGTVSAEDLYFERVKPLLKVKCLSCHGALKAESGLRLDTGSLIREGGESGPAIVVDHADQSLVIERVSSNDEFDRMPPEGEPLTKEQVELLRDWINSGAKSPSNEAPAINPNDHWSFQSLAEYDQSLSIDHFIDLELKKHSLERNDRADQQTLVRRLFLDMHGLPPNQEQVEQFLANDSTEMWEQLVDEVLKSQRYGERWGQHWLDIVRYADTHGFEVNTPRPNAWPYRDYVIQALNEDKPYNEFIFEQLAGDTVGEDAATGFLVAAPVLLPGQIGKDEESKRLARQDSLDEMIIGTSATFLGLTVGCARCHDHKFDPISQADYYAMQAFFAGVDYGDRPIKDEKYEQQQAELKQVRSELVTLRDQIQKFEPDSYVGRTVIIDDEDSEFVTHLKQKKGHGENPQRAKRGYAKDAGNASRIGNIGKRYTWWDNVPGEDVVVYRPQLAGEFQLWISWGAHGSGVHTRDARYVFDADGDLSTQEDQQEIAKVNQERFANQKSGKVEKKPLWSGLFNTCVHRFSKQSCLIVRGGETGTGITADVIVLQEPTDDSPRRTPYLRSPINTRLNTEKFSPITATAVRFTSHATIDSNKHEPCIDELEVFAVWQPHQNVALAANGGVASSSGNYSETGQHQLKHINDGNYGNGKSWISNENGKGWVQVDFGKATEVDRILWGRDRNEKLKDRLASNYEISLRDENGEWHVVASGQDRLPYGTPDSPLNTIIRLQGDSASNLAQLAKQVEQFEKREAKLSKVQQVYAGRFREPDVTHVLYRGDPEQPKDEIGPRAPHQLASSFDVKAATESERRRSLANWITAPSNPLTARVIANRVWQYHFGTGIVRTASDFGLNGEPPSHPELLDWLANELITNNWSLKHLHRLILNSDTYRQSNAISLGAKQIDRDCRLLWRFPSRRLEAEAIRDSILFCTDQLNMKMGGPGFNFFKTRGGLSGFPPVDSFTDEEKRRMVYAHKIRMESVPVFGAFDCPDAGQPAPSRSRSTTAIQALNLFNSPFVLEQSNSLAEAAIANEETTEDQVRFVFRRILNRLPTQQEAIICESSANEHGLTAVCRALFNSNEFLFLP